MSIYDETDKESPCRARPSPGRATSPNQLTECFGLLLDQAQLAELLGRSTGSLRYGLCPPSDARIQALKACGYRIGRRVYYPVVEVARIISGVD